MTQTFEIGQSVRVITAVTKRWIRAQVESVHWLDGVEHVCIGGASRIPASIILTEEEHAAMVLAA